MMINTNKNKRSSLIKDYFFSSILVKSVLWLGSYFSKSDAVMFNDLSNLLIPLASLSNISIVISFNSSFKSFLITFAPVSIAISSNNANLYSPVAGATLPVLAFLLLGVYGKNIFLIFSSIILGIGHIGIHLNHRKEVQ